jgi:hypothetical protein
MRSPTYSKGRSGYGRRRDLQGPGGHLSVEAPGVVHTFWNPGPKPARDVEIFSPAGFERYFEGLAEILSACGPPDIPRLEELAGRYGMTFHWEQMEEIMHRRNDHNTAVTYGRERIPLHGA